MVNTFFKIAYGSYPGFDTVIQRLEECAGVPPACEDCPFFAECQPWFDSMICRFHSRNLARKRINSYLERIAEFSRWKHIHNQVFALFSEGLNLNDIALSLKGAGFNISNWTVRKILYPGRSQ